jgi:hypothetical protein
MKIMGRVIARYPQDLAGAEVVVTHWIPNAKPWLWNQRVHYAPSAALLRGPFSGIAVAKAGEPMHHVGPPFT